ncbi:MAG TPA: peptide deformylase [bacterium]|nr:peptide deformylase [bacterium]
MSARLRVGRVRRLPGIRARSRRIVTLRDADAGILRRRSRPVRLVDRAVRQLVADMLASMRRANGIGLAAPQIGVPLRVVVIDIGGGPLAVINPRIRRRGGSVVGTEGCLSIPGVYGDVRRAQRVEVEGRSIRGRPIVVKSEDLLARVFQHEIDHLNGVLFVDPGRLLRWRWPGRRPRVVRRGR